MTGRYINAHLRGEKGRECLTSSQEEDTHSETATKAIRSHANIN